VIDEFVALPLVELDRLLEAIRRRGVRAPVQRTQLSAELLVDVLPYVSLLARFDSDAALETFVATVVMQRRIAAKAPRPELVWSGPEPKNSQARHTSVVLRSLFEAAQREVFIAGYSFHGGSDVLAPLRAAMDRGVTVEIVLDCSQHEVYVETRGEEILRTVVSSFWKKVWPHASPRPSLLYDPRTLRRSPPGAYGRWFPECSMHAKCVVVDDEVALVGSANFTERAQDNNLEVGVLVRERSFVHGLVHQWNAVRSAGFVLPVDEG